MYLITEIVILIIIYLFLKQRHTILKILELISLNEKKPQDLFNIRSQKARIIEQ